MTLKSGSSGVGSVLDVAGLSLGAEPATDARQLDLLVEDDEYERPEGAALPFESKRGPGRPKGSKNKRATVWVDYYGKRFTMPLEAAGQILSSSWQDIADELERLGMDRADAVERAVQLWRDTLVASLPYLHQKLPVKIEGTGTAVPMLVIGDVQVGAGGALGLEAGPNGVRLMAVGETVTDQGLAPTIDAQSKGGRSNAEG